ncbi:uncharacterized protein LOC111642845 [Copidosoma floridanum]|uniref:uncharacterized protein LOC111642845 n=1 Tax=Copidosoma floridanum TaxID=29053 RepID=UPI000C6FC164|nr:uncharacterized protein LOC111642845 [Copidosoma floridanum]
MSSLYCNITMANMPYPDAPQLLQGTTLLGAINNWRGNFLLWAENFIILLFLTVTQVEYYYIILNIKKNAFIKIEELYKILEHNWNSVNNYNEKAIMIKYSKIGLRYVHIMLGFWIMGFIIAVLSSLLPVYLDMIAPLNEPRPRIAFLRVNIITDPNENYFMHYFACLVLMIVADYITICIVFGFLIFVYQIFGIFNIIKYRLRLATTELAEKKEESYDMIISAVKLHQDCLK